MLSKKLNVNSGFFTRNASAHDDEEYGESYKRISEVKYFKRKFKEELSKMRENERDRERDLDQARREYTPQYTKGEKEAFYNMNGKKLATNKARKFYSQALRRAKKIVETEGDVEGDRMRELFQRLVDSTTPSTTIGDFKKKYFEIKEKLTPDFQPILDKVTTNPIYQFIQEHLPDKKTSAWFGALLLFAESILRSQSLAEDLRALAEITCAMVLGEKESEVTSLIIPILWTLRVAMRSFNKSSSGDIVIETEGSVSEFIFQTRADTAEFITSHFMKSVREIIMILASYHLFPRKVARQFANWFGYVAKPKNIPEAISRIVSDIGHLVNMGEQVFIEGKTLSDVFLSQDPVQEVTKRSNDLILQSEALYFGLPEENKYDAINWVEKTRTTTKDLLAMIGKMNPYDDRTKTLVGCCKILMNKLGDVVGRTRACKRPTPYFIIIAGDPGVGKSSVLTLCFQLWASIKGREFNQRHVFERVSNSPFWDGYDPVGTPYIHISEMGALNENMVKSGLDIAALELTSVIDSLPFSLNMSKADEKGTVFCMPEIVICDTNNEHLNLDLMVQNFSAFQRRGIVIVPHVKDEFRKTDSLALDGNKEIAGVDNMDKWTFDVKRYTPIDLMHSNAIHLLDSTDRKSDILKLMSVLSTDMEKHIKTEERVNELFSKDWVQANKQRIMEQRIKDENLDENSSFYQKEYMDVMCERNRLAIEGEAIQAAMHINDIENKSDIEEITPVSLTWNLNSEKKKLQRLLLLEVLTEKPFYDTEDRVGCDKMIEYTQSLVSKDQSLMDEIGQLVFPSYIINNVRYYAGPWLLKRINSTLFKKVTCKYNVSVEGDYDFPDVPTELPVFEPLISEEDIKRAENPVLVLELEEKQSENFGDYAAGEQSLLVVCNCCDGGYHVPVLESRVRNICNSAIDFIYRFIKYTFLWYIMGCINFPRDFKKMDSLSQMSYILCTAITWIYIPGMKWYTLSVALTSLFGNIYLRITRKVQQFTYQVSVVEAEVRRNVDNAVQFMTRTQTLAYRASIVVSALMLGVIAAKFLSMMYNAFFEKKEKIINYTESDFQSTSAPLLKLRRQEVAYGMSKPHLRIKTANEKIKLYDNVLNDPEKPIHTKADMPEFHASVRKFVRPFLVNVGGKYQRHGYWFGLRGNLGVINKHYIDMSYGQVTITYASSVHAFNDITREYEYSVSQIYTPDDIIEAYSDLVIIKCPPGLQVGNSLKHMPSTVMNLDKIQVYSYGGESIAREVGEVEAYDKANDIYFKQTMAVMYSDPTHAPGTCGLPVTGKVNGGQYIVGMHCSASKHDAISYFIKFDSRALMEKIQILTEGSFIIADSPEGEFDVPVSELSSRSFARFIDQGPVQIHGEYTHFRGNQKSNTELSIFGERKEFLEEMMEVLPEHAMETFKASMMKPQRNLLGVFGSPITEGAKKICVTRIPLNPVAMKKAEDRFGDYIEEKLTLSGVRRDHSPIDFETVLNGSSEDYLSRPVDKTKSGGFGYPGKKKKYLIGVDYDDEIIWEPCDKLAEEVGILLDAYERGCSSSPIFMANLKDEVRTLKKFNSFKTRVFYGTPLAFLMVQKAFMSVLYTLMIEKGDIFCAGLGVDMHRTGHLIKQRLKQFCIDRNSAVNFCEGDYGSFDTGMPYEIGLSACNLSHRLLKFLGYNEDQMHIVNGILTDLLIPRVEFFGDLITVPGLQPSGKYATAEDNSLRNILILLYIWYDNIDSRDLDFFDHVLPCVYGDDLLATVVDSAKDLFNNVVIYHGCKKMGLDFTTSDKGEVTSPFIHEDDISFLKRTFKFHKDLDRECAVLAPSSLMKTLQFIQKSPSEGPLRQYISICTSVLTEYFFWFSDANKYNQMREYMSRVIYENFPMAGDLELPTYQFLLLRYKEGVESLNEC